jgi:hypothetical protein
VLFLTPHSSTLLPQHSFPPYDSIPGADIGMSNQLKTESKTESKTSSPNDDLPPHVTAALSRFEAEVAAEKKLLFDRIWLEEKTKRYPDCDQWDEKSKLTHNIFVNRLVEEEYHKRFSPIRPADST